MIVYRYEKKDGGGPFCTKDGYLRTNNKVRFYDNTLYGCVSLESLQEYFKNYADLILDCDIVTYDVPEHECVIQERQVIFPKKYAY